MLLDDDVVKHGALLLFIDFLVLFRSWQQQQGYRDNRNQGYGQQQGYGRDRGGFNRGGGPNRGGWNRGGQNQNYRGGYNQNYRGGYRGGYY